MFSFCQWHLLASMYKAQQRLVSLFAVAFIAPSFNVFLWNSGYALLLCKRVYLCVRFFFVNA